ncbi:hypothetical protein [uncultured Catenibacterium sp.]|nr:hypothetical protein [uncultured Catenibacterium sp.]
MKKAVCINGISTDEIWKIDVNKTIDDLDNLVDKLEDYQLEYTGLVRLRF